MSAVLVRLAGLLLRLAARIGPEHDKKALGHFTRLLSYMT